MFGPVVSGKYCHRPVFFVLFFVFLWNLIKLSGLPVFSSLKIEFHGKYQGNKKINNFIYISGYFENAPEEGSSGH